MKWRGMIKKTGKCKKSYKMWDSFNAFKWGINPSVYGWRFSVESRIDPSENATIHTGALSDRKERLSCWAETIDYREAAQAQRGKMKEFRSRFPTQSAQKQIRRDFNSA